MRKAIKLYAHLISILNSAEWLASSPEKNGAPVGPQICSRLRDEKTMSAPLEQSNTDCKAHNLSLY
jgi:hypothetical protein